MAREILVKVLRPIEDRGTLADEVLRERIDIIEAQLAHQVSDALGRAYNRTSFLKERRAMMNRWGSYLDELKNERKVISLKRNQGSSFSH